MTPDIESRTVDVEEMLLRPGTYFNPQTEIVVIVDDSTSIDQEIFNMEAYEGSDWVRISDDLPVDEDSLEQTLEEFQTHYHGGTAGVGLGDRARAGRRDRRRGRGRTSPRTPDERTDGGLLGRQARGSHRLDGRLPGIRRDALVLGRARDRAGLVQLADDAAGHRRPRQLWPPPPRPGGGLLRDRAAGSRSRSTTTSSRPARKPRCGSAATPSARSTTTPARRPSCSSCSTRDPDAGTEKTEDFWPE